MRAGAFSQAHQETNWLSFKGAPESPVGPLKLSVEVHDLRANLMEIKGNKLDNIVWPTFSIIENYLNIILRSRKIEFYQVEGSKREKIKILGNLNGLNFRPYSFIDIIKKYQ